MFNQPLEKFLKLTGRRKLFLEKTGLKTARDLLWHFPLRYEKTFVFKKIAELQKEDEAKIKGKVLSAGLRKTWRKKISLSEALIQDESGILRLVWFNQPYIASILKQGETYVFSGKAGADKNGLYIANPLFEKETFLTEKEIPTRKIFPVYPSVYGASSRWFYYKIEKLLDELKKETLPDPIPHQILKKYSLPSLKNALLNIHNPPDLKYAEAAEKRFSFEEIFLIQLSRLKEKILRKNTAAYKINIQPEEIKKFIDSFSFKLTASQEKAVKTILEDLKEDKPMTRLLEGDVGSGKTVVAIVAAFAAIKSGFQVAYMAPTEVLSRQIFNEFISYLKKEKIKIGLLTSSQSLKFPSKISRNPHAKISKNQLSRWVKNGEISLLIGTHSLISEKIDFKNLALVVIDEQHRFGVNQRGAIVKKNILRIPHLLSMTATPIPRTLALTIYGDLDLTLLEDLPPERKSIKTLIAPPEQRNRVYEMMRRIIKEGRQAYVVCPRIEPKEPHEHDELSEELKAVKAEYQRLKKEVFSEFEIGFIHGKLLPKEKEEVFRKFRENKIRILVSTSLIEVGVNVPNATMILIEGAERFGLAQLHQMRGRVLRSVYQPYCFIFYGNASTKTLKRLKALLEAKNGFELAEYDLKFRGPGSLSGGRQWGLSDVAMKGLQNLKMVEAARKEAEELLKKDFEFKNYPLLSLALQKYSLFSIHPE